MNLVVYYNGTHIKDGMESIPITINPLDILLLIMLGLGTIICLIVITSILWSKKARVEGFNLYLIFYLIPDTCFNLQQFIIKLISVISGIWPFPSTTICTLSPIVAAIYVIINLWMNVLIAYNTFKLLQYSHQGKRYHPSSRQVVFRRVGIVYTLATIIGVLYATNMRGFYDVRIDSRTCVTRLNGRLSYIVYYTVAFLCLITPCLYLLYVAFSVHKNKFLPTISSKTRFLALYFFRIAFIACGLTITSLILVGLNIYHEVFPFVMTTQSIFVSLIAVTKNDIHEAIIDSFCCRLKLSSFDRTDRVSIVSNTDPLSTLPNE